MAGEWWLGRDLDVGLVADGEGTVVAGPPTRLDLQAVRRDDVLPRTLDLGVAAERADLVQALVLRLLTERGELEGLGHPEYGSRHHALIGEPNTERVRALIKLYVLECLKQEPRLGRILGVDVRPGAGREHRDTVRISIRAQMKGQLDPLNLVVPFSLQGGPA
jgi:hypothetical protein